MLKELYLEYKDGRKETKIIYVEPNQQVIIYPQKDNIKFSNCKSFKYKVHKHPYLCVAIVRYSTKTVIMPEGIECHPKTTFNDIEVIDNLPKEKPEPKPREKHTWKFESTSSEGSYIVRENMGKLSCNCMGYFRAKDREKGCKHMQQVRSWLLEG